MEKYYHFTKYSSLQEISTNGLVPQIGDRSFSVNDEKKVVFLSREKLSAILMFFAMRWFYNSHHGEEGKKLLAKAVSSIEYYEKKLLKREKQGNHLSFLRSSIEELKNNRDMAIMTKEQVENMNRYSSFEEYWGKGVYLSITNVTDVKHMDSDFHNCWVEKEIPPEDINVVLLKHRKTGDLVDDKDSIVNYFMSTTTDSDLFTEYLNTIGINDDKYTAHSVMKEFSEYYFSHKEEFNILKNDYDLIEMPISEYMQLDNRDTNKRL